MARVGHGYCKIGWRNKQQKLLALPMRKKNVKTKHMLPVVRTAGRKFQDAASRPSSREYTTRKDARPSIVVSFDGVQDDYNHYRTVALKSTPDRALSILTTDVMKILRSVYPTCQDGDFGENVMVDNISFRDLAVGMRFEFSSRQNVIIEITEPIVPCANLCKLPYINNDKLSASDRIARCQDFIEFLGKADGFRGWYAKIIQPGEIHVGDHFLAHSHL